MLGEKVRQDVRKKMPLSDNQMRIYNTQQLGVEIEAIKVQERALLTKVESQQYIETEMKNEIKSAKTQLEGSLEVVIDDLEKLK